MFPFSVPWVQRELQRDGVVLVRTLPWSPDLELGAGELDPEHRRLVVRANSLLVALGSRDAHRVGMAYTSLAATAAAHFESEEAQMRRSGFDGATEHAERHVELARRLAEVRFSHFTPYGLGQSLGALPFLERWLLPHMLRSDRSFADSLAGEPADR